MIFSWCKYCLNNVKLHISVNSYFIIDKTIYMPFYINFRW